MSIPEINLNTREDTDLSQCDHPVTRLILCENIFILQPWLGYHYRNIATVLIMRKGRNKTKSCCIKPVHFFLHRERDHLYTCYIRSHPQVSRP